MQIYNEWVFPAQTQYPVALLLSRQRREFAAVPIRMIEEKEGWYGVFSFRATLPSHLETDVSDGVIGPVILIELLRCRLRYIAVPVRRKAPIKDDFPNGFFR